MERTIKGIPNEALKTYAVLRVKPYLNEVLLTLAQQKGYITPMIVVNKKELLEALTEETVSPSPSELGF